MAAHIDNLKRGDWITIVECFDREDPIDFGLFMRYRGSSHMDGIPLLVLATNYPFVAVSGPGRIFSIDVRRFGLTKLSRSYVNVFVDRVKVKDQYGEELTASLRPKRKKKKEQPDPRRCVRCGSRLRQRLSRDHSCWVPICPGCGWTGDPVPTED